MSVSFYIVGIPDNEENFVNFSNANAISLLRVLNYSVTEDDWYCGEIKHKDIPTWLQRTMVVINDPNKRAAEVEDSYSEDNLFYGGRSDESIVRRAVQLRDLLVKANKLGKDVTWS